MTTYSINIAPERRVTTDMAIALHLRAHPNDSVDDALDTLFQTGVAARIAAAGEFERIAAASHLEEELHL